MASELLNAIDARCMSEGQCSARAGPLIGQILNITELGSSDLPILRPGLRQARLPFKDKLQAPPPSQLAPIQSCWNLRIACSILSFSA